MRVNERVWSWVGCALAAVTLVVVACASGDGDTVAPGPAATVTTTAAPVPSPSTDPADPPPPGYAEPCQRVAKLAAEWVDLAVRIAESESPGDISRPEVESLINRLVAVTPELPADVQSLMPSLVDPLVQFRGVLMTGTDTTIVLGQGRDAVPQIFEGCATYVPNYDDGPGGAGS